MNADELRVLIEQFRKGERGEGSAHEIKRQWWDFVRNAEEFTRDIAAMANADTDEEKIIFVGIKDGELFDAPLPEDEARLQKRLHRIEPLPKVRFSQVSIDDKTVSCIEVLPPYDKPYVNTSEHAKPGIPVRRGSMIGAANRRELDRWYHVGRSGAAQLWYSGQALPSELSFVLRHREMPEYAGASVGRLRTAIPNVLGTLLQRDLDDPVLRGDVINQVRASDVRRALDDENLLFVLKEFEVVNSGRIQLRDVILEIEVKPSEAGEEEEEEEERHDRPPFVTSWEIGTVNPGFSRYSGEVGIRLPKNAVFVAPLRYKLLYTIGAHTGTVGEGEVQLTISFTRERISQEEVIEIADRLATARLYRY